MKHTLLVELFTEELPPKALPRLAASFAGAIVASLIEKKLVAADAQPTIFASPRRLGVSIPAVLAVAADEEAVEKIMPVAVALGADGQPSPALRKKLEARGIPLDAVAQFERRLDGKSETFFYRYQAAGAKLADVLAGMVQDAVKKLPIPKVMRWGDSDVTFVRPVHKLVMLHGAEVVAGEVLGLTAGRETGGHRFLSAGAVTLTDADSYVSTLQSVGKVVPSFEARRDAQHFASHHLGAVQHHQLVHRTDKGHVRIAPAHHLGNRQFLDGVLHHAGQHIGQLGAGSLVAVEKGFALAIQTTLELGDGV
jgi:glycyl-tRNA synthetase beta chain